MHTQVLVWRPQPARRKARRAGRESRLIVAALGWCAACSPGTEAPPDHSAWHDAASPPGVPTGKTTSIDGGVHDAPSLAEPHAGPDQQPNPNAPPNTRPSAPDAEVNAPTALADAGLHGSDGALPDHTYSAQDLSPTIGNFTYQGSLCPSNSTTFSANSGAFTIVIAAQLDGALGEASGSCTLSLELTAPAGLRFGAPHLCPVSDVSEGGADGALDVKYSYDSGGSQSFSYAVPAGTTLTACEQLKDLWTPTCIGADSTASVRLTIELSARAPAGSLLSLSSVDGGFAYADGTKWQSCVDASPVQPPASAAGQTCGGRPDHPCADKLVCDRVDEGHDDTALSGTCVDPSQAVPAQSENGACGGARHVVCGPKLICSYSTPERAAMNLVGTCLVATGEEGQHCGGTPSVACQAGLACSAHDVCVHATGQLGSLCDQQLPACVEGLRCSATQSPPVCERIPARWGDACGAAGAAPCEPSLICDATSQTCKDKHPGALGTRCDSDQRRCNDPLVCVDYFCRNAPLPLGSPCKVSSDCQSHRCMDPSLPPDPADANQPTASDHPAAQASGQTSTFVCVAAEA